MYLHLGGDTVVRTEEIIAICDLDNASYAQNTRKFLARAEKEGRVVNVSDDLPKSFVVCREGEEQRIYLSQLNAATLVKRAENGMID